MKTIDYETAIREAGALAALLGVPAARIVAEVAALALDAGCRIAGCDDTDPAPAPLPDLAGRYRDDADELAREAAGITRSGR